MIGKQLLFRLALLVSIIAASSVRADDGNEDLIWPTESDVRVDIEILSGKIEIEGWDRDEVRLRVDGGDSSGLDIEAGRRRVSIRSPGGRRGGFPWRGIGADIEVEIYVPAASRIEAKTINGEIRAEGVNGTVDFHAANGSIEVQGRPRDANLETINSSIKFEGEASRVDARTVNGSIELRGVAQEVSASTMSGSIKVEAGTIERVDLKTLSGSIELIARLAKRARARIKSFSGSIKLELPSDTSAHFELQSFSGGISNELAASSSASAPRSGGQHLEFTAGDGDGRVMIENFSGGIKIVVDE